MATTEYEGGTGGKFRKRPLQRVQPTPYERPPSAARGIRGPPPATEAGGSGWLSKLVDPAARVIVRSASRIFSSVLGKGLAAPLGENVRTIEEVPEVKSSLEVREEGGNPVDARLSIHYDGSDKSEQELICGTDDISKLEQLLKQKRFSRAETELLIELLHSRTIEPSTLPLAHYKNKEKVDDDSNIDPSSSHQPVNHEEKEKANASELETQGEQLVNLQGNDTSGVNVNIPEEGFGSPIEIARAYMSFKPLKAAPSTLGLQRKICHRDKASPLNSPFRNKLSNAAIASRSAIRFPVIPADSGNDLMTPKPQGRSALYKLSRSRYCRSVMMTNPREYGPYNDSYVEATRSLEWTPSLSNIRHSGHGQALKRGSSDSDAGGYGDARRVRQKSCLKGLHLSNCADTSTSFLGQEYRQDIDLKGLENLDGRIPSASILHVPPRSTEMARKILHQLDKLQVSPQNKSFEKKVIVGDASLSKSSLSAFDEGSLKIKGNNDSTNLVTLRGSRIVKEPSSSNLARITSSASPNQDKAKEKASPMPSISGPEVESSCLGVNSYVTYASDANHGMRSMDSNGHGFAFLSMQKEPTVQSAPHIKVESTKAEHAILASVKEPREKSVVHSLEYVPTSRLMHTESDTKTPDKASTEKDVSFMFLAARTSNTLSKPLLSSTMETALADGATPKEEDTVSPFKFGSKVSADDATKPISTGISASVQTRETVVERPTSELDRGVSSTPALAYDNSVSSTFFASTGTSANSSGTFFSSAAPRLQFGSGNSTIHSFTGLSAVSSSIGNGAPKFQFGSVNSTSYSFTGVSAVSSSTASGVSTPVLSSLYPVTRGSGSLSTSAVIPISANGVFDVNTSSASGGSSLQFASSSSQNTARNFGAAAASSCGTNEISSGNGVANFSGSSVCQFGALDSQATFGLGSSLQASCSSHIGFAISDAKPLSSCLSSSYGASLSSSSNSSLSPAVPASFSTSSSPSSLSSTSSATLGSTLLSPLSTGFSFGMPTSASGSVPFVLSSGSILPLASTGTTTSAASLWPAQSVFGLPTSTTGFRSGSPSNDQLMVENSRAGNNLQAAPMAPTLGQSTNLQPDPSGAQVFQFGTGQNNSGRQNSSTFQASANLGFSAGGSFSLGSGGGEKSERKFIKVRRDKLRRK